MSEDSQLDVPQSFIALFLKPGASRPNAPQAFIVQRYEFCEDMAAMLTQTAQEMLHGHSLSEARVLQNIHQALTSAPQADSVVSDAEVVWVVWRVAELSGWAAPQSLGTPR